MSGHFDLIVDTAAEGRVARVRLQDDAGRLLAEHDADIAGMRAGLREGLFDLRNAVQRHADDSQQAEAVDEVGLCIAQQVLGDAIMGHLWRPEHQRTLRVLLPGAADEDRPLAAALARVPWEIARPAPGQPSLADRNLLVRVVHSMAPPHSQPMQLDSDEPLRLLIVFAEARGARPLGARAERLALLQMLRTQVYPQRRVQADVLCHGVTRARLQEQVRQQGGYHLLHWSGHGHRNLLELAGEDGGPDHLSGADLLGLFIDAGGFLPRLVFLSACHSGDFVRVRDWDDFQAVAQGRAPHVAAAADSSDPHAALPLERKLDLAERPGFTGTAHALLQGGVPSVVAMRYAVGDDYAAALAVGFYRALLADAQPKSAAAALTQARRALRQPGHPDARRFAACDHATPLLYGQEHPGLLLPAGPSPALNPPNPCLHHIAEFQGAAHAHFVGRSWELAALHAGFLGNAPGAVTPAVALVTGLGGMGKTALVAELLALWQQRFQWVLLYQAKPHAWGLDSWLRDVHASLHAELGLYHQHVKAKPADAIYRDAEPGFDGAARLQRLTRNLLRALHSEPVLLVLDNFETHLAAPAPGEAAAADARCADPAWDAVLQALASGLAGSPSRLLVTSRRPVAALPAASVCGVALGPLPATEAALFPRQHPVLARWLFSADAAEQALARRLLAASRFHPLLMDRLARLAAVPGQAATLQAALAALEGTAGHAALPALFAARPGDAAELAYLDEALVQSLDRLIAELEPVARQALWLVALTNQPEPGALLQAVWAGEEDEKTQILRRMQALLADLPNLPPGFQQQFRDLPAELRAEIEQLPPRPPAPPPLAPLLHQLAGLGLLGAAGAAIAGNPAGESGASTWACHELVRERILAWMAVHPVEQCGRDAVTWYGGLAKQLQPVYRALQGKGSVNAPNVGRRALVYTAQAGDWDQLGRFASSVVTQLRDVRQLQQLLPHLQSAADAAPEGQARWACLTCLADALRMAQQPDASLAFYERALALARRAAEAGGDEAKQAWSDLGWIGGQSACALADLGDYSAAKRRHIEAADAKRRGGRPLIHVINSELAALEMDVLLGDAKKALFAIEERLTVVACWLELHSAGQPVPEAPDGEMLFSVYLDVLGKAQGAEVSLQDWHAAMRRIDAILDFLRVNRRTHPDMPALRMRRAIALQHLPGRLPEAKAEMSACLDLFRGDPGRSAAALFAFASTYAEQGDLCQAVVLQRKALAMFELLPGAAGRAVSHHNLALFLDRLGGPEALAESPQHLMAALVYRFVAFLGEQLQSSMHNYIRIFGYAKAAGERLSIPRVADLVADPAFHVLALWLRQRQENLDELQVGIDELLGSLRQTAQSLAE